MLNYVHADLSLIFRRVQRYLTVALMLAAELIYFAFIQKTLNWNSVNFVSTLSMALSVMPVLMGLFEMSFVFSEDFRAKTMQVAIGCGISRRQVVLAKLLEFSVLLLTDILAMLLLAFGFGFVSGIRLLPEQLLEIFCWGFCEWLSSVVLASMTMILLFRFQKAGMSLLLYLVLGIDPIHMILDFLAMSNSLAARLNLSRFSYGALNDLFRSRLILSQFDILSFIGIMIYIIGAYALTCLLFRKQELEF